MNATSLNTFDQSDLATQLALLDDAALDALDFGVIGFDSDTLVRRYNAFESRAAGLSPRHVLDLPLFTSVAPCMNNFLVAQRFEDALDASTALDATIPYVLTLRMRPTKVLLRLLADPADPLRYVLIQRS